MRNVLDVIDAYWASLLGCPPNGLRPVWGQAFAHTGLGAYAGAFALSVEGNAPVASVPTKYLATARALAPGWTPDSVYDAAAIGAVLAADAGIAIGPAIIGYCGRVHDRIALPGVTTRLLAPSSADDVTAVDHLRSASSTLDWEHGGANLTCTAAGAFVGHTLASFASYELWGDFIAHIGVVTHPDWRGHSFGRSSVALLTAHLISTGLIPQYRTLQSNAASLALGVNVGFVPYATAMSVRLRAGES